MKLVTSSIGNEEKDNSVARGKVSKGEDNRSNVETETNNRYWDERERRKVTASVVGASYQTYAKGDHDVDGLLI
jgi:hypothetical protein